MRRLQQKTNDLADIDRRLGKLRTFVSAWLARTSPLCPRLGLVAFHEQESSTSRPPHAAHFSGSVCSGVMSLP